MSSAKLLQRLSIKSPCSANWNEMTGNEQVRFCSHCELSVQDLSQMSRPQAVQLVLRSKGRLCLRVHRNPAGEIITGLQKLHTISGRASKFVAGAFTAVVSLSAAAYAQTPAIDTSNANRSVAQDTLKTVPSGNLTSLAGTVLDPNGAVIPGAQVTLINDQTSEVQIMQTGDDGQFRFWVPSENTYSIMVEAHPFTYYRKASISVNGADETRVDVNLLYTGPPQVMGDVVMIEYKQPLLKAANDGDLAAVKRLLRNGENVNQAEEDGITALDLAVSQGNVRLVRRLLRAGALPELEQTDGQTSLFWLGEENSAQLIAMLVNAGANINRTDHNGNSPLIHVAEYGDAELMQAMIDAGAYVNAQNQEGETALMLAAETGNEAAVKVLLDAGAIHGLRNSDGKDALQLACENDRAAMVELLHAAGAVDSVIVSGDTLPSIKPVPIIEPKD